jgi:hypothetical protein
MLNFYISGWLAEIVLHVLLSAVMKDKQGAVTPMKNN